MCIRDSPRPVPVPLMYLSTTPPRPVPVPHMYLNPYQYLTCTSVPLLPRPVPVPHMYLSTTPPDPYQFPLHLSLGTVTDQSAVVHYSGVPEPEEKYVNVYQLVYLRESDRVHGHLYRSPHDHHQYGENVNEAGGGSRGPPDGAGPLEPYQFVVRDLKSDQTYQLWLVAYLSNGRTIKSNVLDVRTNASTLPVPQRSELDATSLDAPHPATSPASPATPATYYSSMVAAAAVAAVACVALLAVVAVLVRRQTLATAAINGDRGGIKTTSVASAAYDNPSYKTYDLEMNGMKSNNGAGAASDS
ncbi:putative epidermal cell surface receptor [Hyalella azteca]|uniref:Epidermal cell surface receptor n=1 Tax=Hyalella azteca TaxID=294128 RepID=A0A8B7P449_HYAAZ|nr:putative epidermal cell surface receptor [Hyalella azteca]